MGWWMGGSDNSVVLLLVLMFHVESVFWIGFCFGGQRVDGWIEEGVGVGWLIALHPPNVVGKDHVLRVPGFSEIEGRRCKQPSQGGMCMCVCQLASSWSPLKPAGLKPQIVESEGICHLAYGKVGIVRQRQPAGGHSFTVS